MLIFSGNRLLIRKGTYDFDEAYTNSRSILSGSRDLPANWQRLTSWADIGDSPDLEEGEELIGLRELWHLTGDSEFARAGGALQFADWFRNVRLCSKCGGELVPSESDYGRVCSKCGKVFYVQISPAVITAVEREGRLLLAHNAAWPEGRYSIIAGFVEPGERLEGAVSREILEEVSVSVKGIKYFGSQTWPFPNSLMLGFTAEYDSGEIVPDGTEITSAGWFSVEEMRSMNLPDGASIARKLIDDFMARHS